MLKRIIDIIIGLLFGNEFFEGYVAEPKEKDKYVIASIFTDEKVFDEIYGETKSVK